MIINRPSVIILSLGVFLINFTFIKFNQFPITGGTIGCLLIIYFLIRNVRPNYFKMVGLFFLLCYPLLFLYSIVSLGEFFKSYLQYMVLTLSVVFSTEFEGFAEETLITFLLMLSCGGALIASFVIIQFISMNYFSSYVLLNPFGGMLSLGPGGVIYEPHMFATIKRPNAFYSEPSVCAWLLVWLSGVSIYGYKMQYLKSKYWYFVTLLMLVGSGLTYTLSGFLNSLLLLTLLFVKENLVNKKYKPIVIAVWILVLVIFLSFAKYSGLLKRFDDVFVERTSVYFRVIAPTYLMRESLIDYPLGHPLGDEDYIESKEYMLNWSGGNNSNIENSFLYYIYYMGLIGMALVLYLLVEIIILYLSHKPAIFIMVPLALALCETGALWSPNIVLIICLSIMITKNTIGKNYGEI